MSDVAISRIELGASQVCDSRDGSCLYQHLRGPVMVSVTSLELSVEPVRCVYPLHECTIVCQLSRLVIPSSFTGEPFVS